MVQRGADPNLRDAAGYTALVGALGAVHHRPWALGCELLSRLDVSALCQSRRSLRCVHVSSGERCLRVSADPRRCHAAPSVGLLRSPGCGQTAAGPQSQPQPLR